MNMQMVIAFLPPHRVESVARRLRKLPAFPGMTVSDARGHGHEKAETPRDSRAELTDFTATSRVEIALPQALVEPVLDAIFQEAHTGEAGDGKVYVVPIRDALRIKTGERGPVAV